MACCACCCETKQNGTCCGEGEDAVCCPEGEYCQEGECVDCDPPCSAEDCLTCVGGECVYACESGFSCCLNQNGVRGCFKNPTGVIKSCAGEDWCSTCVPATGGTDTRTGPFADEQDAIDECNSSGQACNADGGIATTFISLCPEGYYCYLCCDEDVP